MAEALCAPPPWLQEVTGDIDDILSRRMLEIPARRLLQVAYCAENVDSLCREYEGVIHWQAMTPHRPMIAKARAGAAGARRLDGDDWRHYR